MIEIGRKVGVLYEGRLEDGTVFDSSARHGGVPLEFVVGGGQVIPGLDRAVSEMSPREKRTVAIPARDAYGERDDRLLEWVPADIVPNVGSLPVGEYIMLSLPGEFRRLKVAAVEDGRVLFDGNHELAGHDLTFDVEVVSVLGETGSLIENEQHAEGCTCGCHRFKDQVRNAAMSASFEAR